MSQAKVKTVGKAQKDQGQCEKCGTMLPAGSAYRWFKVGFRSRHKHVRCLEPGCTPRPSELESSRMADAYAAQEEAHDAIDLAETLEEIQGALTDCGSAAQEVASEYESSIDAAPMLEDQLREYVDQLEDWASNLDNATDLPDEDDFHCEEHEEKDEDCDDCIEAETNGIADAKEAARSLVDSLEG